MLRICWRNADSSYETVRRWVNHFGPKIAADLRNRRPKPHTTWHLDEVYLKIDGRMVYLCRAVDAEGEVLDVLVQTRRNKRAALKLMRKMLKKYGFVPDKVATDDLRSYGAAAGHLGISNRHTVPIVFRVSVCVAHDHGERPPATKFLQGDQVMMLGIVPRRPCVAAIVHSEIFNNASAPQGSLECRLNLAASRLIIVPARSPVRRSVRFPEHFPFAVREVRQHSNKIPMQWHAARVSVFGLRKRDMRA